MKKNDKPIYLEVYFDEGEDITEDFERLLRSDQFKVILKTEVLDRIYTAIKEEKEEYPLFRLVHYEVDFVLDKKEYKKILKTIF